MKFLINVIFILLILLNVILCEECTDGVCTASSSTINNNNNKNNNDNNKEIVKCTKLIYAIYRDDIKAVKRLANNKNVYCYGASGRYSNVPPLQLALLKRNTNIAHHLLKVGADANWMNINIAEKSFVPALFYALGYQAFTNDMHPNRKNLPLITMLIKEFNADINIESWLPSIRLIYPQVKPKFYTLKLTPLLWSTWIGYTSGVELLLENGANINAQINTRISEENNNIDHNSMAQDLSALHLCILGAGERNQVSLLKVLLKYNPNLLITDKYGRTPLHYIVIKQAFKMLNMYLEYMNSLSDKSLIINILNAKDNNNQRSIDMALDKPINKEIYRRLASYYHKYDIKNFNKLPNNNYINEEDIKEWNNINHGDWQWVDDDEIKLNSKQCDIDRINYNDININEFVQQYYMRQRPLILTGNITSEWLAWSNWKPSLLNKNYGHKSLHAGPIPYGSVYNRKQRKIKLNKFLKLMNLTKSSILKKSPKKIPWIIFDRFIHQNTKQFQKDMSTPKYFKAFRENQVQISLGSYGAGASWHHHLDGWSALVYGKKKWFLLPTTMHHQLKHPSNSKFKKLLKPANGLLSSGAHTLQWYYNDYLPHVKDNFQVYECTQGPGEILYVPRLWNHATINLADSIAVAVEFLQHPHFEIYFMQHKAYRDVLHAIEFMFQVDLDSQKSQLRH